MLRKVSWLIKKISFMIQIYEFFNHWLKPTFLFWFESEEDQLFLISDFLKIDFKMVTGLMCKKGRQFGEKILAAQISPICHICPDSWKLK